MSKPSHAYLSSPHLLGTIMSTSTFDHPDEIVHKVLDILTRDSYGRPQPAVKLVSRQFYRWYGNLPHWCCIDH